jgi:hypothetical protein
MLASTPNPGNGSGVRPHQRANPKGWKRVAGGRQAFEATSGLSFNPPLHLEKVPDIFAEYGVSGTTFGVRGKRDREPGVSLLDPGHSLATLRVGLPEILVALPEDGRTAFRETP